MANLLVDENEMKTFVVMPKDEEKVHDAAVAMTGGFVSTTIVTSTKEEAMDTLMMATEANTNAKGCRELNRL